MEWWHWVVGGLLLLGVELVTPGGLFALFFGLSALVVAALSALGVEALWLQWLLFSVIALAAVVGLRKPLRARLVPASHDRPVDALVGQPGVALTAVAAGGDGKVEVRGSSWTARSAVVALAPGQRCRVERVEGLTLWVRPD